MKKKFLFSLGKRAYRKDKFYFFHKPLRKETMLQEKFLFFYWIGPWFVACQKAR